MPELDLLCIGEANVDLILSGVPRLPAFGEEVLADAIGMHVGGCTANVATFAARLGMRVGLRARVGTDEFGDFVVAGLQQAGVNTDFIIRTPAGCQRRSGGTVAAPEPVGHSQDSTLRTGVTVSLSGREDRAFVTYVGTIDSLTAADVDDRLLARARHVHIGSYFLQRKLQPAVAGIFARARKLGLTTSLDTGYDPYQTWDSGLAEVLPHTDLLLPNEVEAPAIAGVADPREAGQLLARRAGRVALKLGDEGAVLFAGGETLNAPAYPVDVVDTTCCGDAFNAGFLCAMLEGSEPAECLRWGCAAGAIIAGGSGTSPERLSREAIRTLVGRL